MKAKLITILFLTPVINFGQVLLPLVSNQTSDFVTRTLYDSNSLVVLNNQNFRLDYNLTSIPEKTNEIVSYNLRNNTKIIQDFYSTKDSNCVLLDLIKHSEDTIAFIKYTFDTIPANNFKYTYTKTNKNFDFFINQKLNIPFHLSDIYETKKYGDTLLFSAYYFDNMGGIFTYDCQYSLSTHSFSTISQGYINSDVNPRIKVNDSIRLKIMDYGLNQVKYYLNDTNIIDSITFSNELFRSGYKSKIVQNNLFFTGIRTHSNPLSDTEIKTVYRHKLFSDSVKEIFIDTVPDNTLKSIYEIDLIDTNHIYTVATGRPCYITPFSALCDNFFRIYSIKSDGNLNWQKTMGGDANYYPFHVIATEDTGVVVLVQKYDENQFAYSQDCYWIKFDKNGNQDSTILRNPIDITFIEEINQTYDKVILFPNPATDIVTIQHNIPESELYKTVLINSIGQFEMDVKTEIIDVSKLKSGMYFLVISTKNGTITKKIIKK